VILTLLLSFVVGVLATRWLALHAFALDFPVVAAMIVVPLVQAAVLLTWRGWFARRRS
jgi:hypothetical protein